jgi:UDP-3-O-[3-hydroxymyristoyl] glucosamine N-acyltransferase
MRRSLQEVAEAVAARLVGDGNIQVSGVASLASAGLEDLVFIEDPNRLASALKSRAGAVIAGEFAAEAFAAKAALICENPKLAFARAAEFLRNRDTQRGGVHPMAVVHSSARVAAGAVVAERAVIAEQSEIGEGTPDALLVVGRKLGAHARFIPTLRYTRERPSATA